VAVIDRFDVDGAVDIALGRIMEGHVADGQPGGIEIVQIKYGGCGRAWGEREGDAGGRIPRAKEGPSRGVGPFERGVVARAMKAGVDCFSFFHFFFSALLRDSAVKSHRGLTALRLEIIHAPGAGEGVGHGSGVGLGVGSGEGVGAGVGVKEGVAVRMGVGVGVPPV